jgi:hypothetical protein
MTKTIANSVRLILFCDSLTNFPYELMTQIVHWRNHLKFPEDTQLSVDAIDLMTRLLCDAEHRAGVEQIKVSF